jgi:hypothetical protein
MSREPTALLSLECGYRMPYSEAELAVARDFFLSSVYIDEDNPARFNPTAIDSILTNMSGLSVLKYNSSWNPKAPYLEQVILPIPGWPLHSSYAFHRRHPPPHRQDSKRKPRIGNGAHRNMPLSSRHPVSRLGGRGTAHDPIIID